MTPSAVARAPTRLPAETPGSARMGATPLVSIVVTNHNYARFLPEAVESALAQTWPRVEVVVVDDGSTADSRALLAGYGERIALLLQENRGQAAAMNAGFAASHGEAVLFLDADDRLMPDVVARVVAAWQERPDAAKVQYRMVVIDATGTPTGAIKPPPYVSLLSGDLRRHYLAFPDDVWRVATSGNAFPAWVLRCICPVPEADYRTGPDTYLTHLAPLYGPVISLDTVGAAYRVHGGNRFEQATPTLDLRRIRRSVTHSALTNRYIAQHARALGLPAGRATGEDILSVAFMVNRVISRKLAPAQHPLPHDRLPELLLLGARAVRQRFDVHGAMRVLYLLWFGAFVLAPRPLARALAERMYFPETRRGLNRLLGRLQRTSS